MTETTQAVEIAEHDIIAVSGAQVSCELDGEVVILCLEDGKYYGLDLIGTRIWSLIQEPRTLREVRDVLLQEFDVEPGVCAQEVKALLQELSSRELVNIKHETTP